MKYENDQQANIFIPLNKKLQLTFVQTKSRVMV